MVSRMRNLWRNLVHRDRVERELDEEVGYAFDLLVQEKMRTGLSEAAARRAATIELGRVESITAQVKDVRAGAFVESLAQDLRYGLRLLRRSPLFTLFAVVSLALGIGAAGGIFLLFDSLVVRKLPVPEPDRLVLLSFGKPGSEGNYWLPYPHFEAIRTRSATLSGVFAISPLGPVSVGARGDAEVAEGVYATGDYHRTLGLVPAAGRLFVAVDDRPGQSVAVLSHAYWQRRFGGRADVVGTTVTLNTMPFTVVGVEPARFRGTAVGRPYDVVIPMRAREAFSEEKPSWDHPFATWIQVMGRMQPHVSLADAERELKVMFAQVSADAARTPAQMRLAREHQLKVESGARGSLSGLRRGYERPLELLLMALGAVLLLASLNIATLLLSRSDARQHEISTRQALGAGRWRLIRQLVTESLLLASLGGALGFAIASAGSRMLLRMATPGREQLPLDLALTGRFALFILLVATMACLFFGVGPALRATSRSAAIPGRQVGGQRRPLLDRTLVASQVALSVVLLVSAGLFLRTLDKLWSEDTGYDRRNMLLFSVDARLAGKKGADVLDVYRRLLDTLRAVPGALSVTASAVRPVSTNLYLIDSISQIGDRSLPEGQGIRVVSNIVAPGYFATLRIPLVAGRDFDERDSAPAPKVAIVSERLARHFAGNPLGQRIGRGKAALEVVGVAKDTRYARLHDNPRELVYVPLFQTPPQYPPTFEVRYAGVPTDIVRSIREAVSRSQPGLEIFGVRTLEGQTEDALSRERLLALLTSYFGGFAVLLACVGLYGLMSYGVTQRTPELGVRMALGAQPASVRWLILREAAVTVVAGTAIGLLAATGTVRLVRTQLYGIEPYDPFAFTGAISLLLAMAFLAAYLPARRASRINPLAALRHE